VAAIFIGYSATGVRTVENYDCQMANTVLIVGKRFETVKAGDKDRCFRDRESEWF